MQSNKSQLISGFLVALELKIVPVKPYVHMRYIPVKGQSKYCQMMRDLSGAYDAEAELPDYLEATVFNKNDAVIMIGNFAEVKTEEQKAKINHVTKWYKPWFYKHVETFLDKGETEEYIPLRYTNFERNTKVHLSWGDNSLQKLKTVRMPKLTMLPNGRTRGFTNM